MAPKRRAAYLRKSRKDKALEAAGIDTLERHEKILRDMATQQGVEIDEWYRETVSGDSIESRPEMQRLLADVHSNKWDEVWCTELERLARGDNRDQATVAEAFKYSETLIVTPTKTYDPNDEVDEEYFEFGLFMSRREYKTIKRRLQAGVKLSVLEGNYLSPNAPFGYDIVDRGRRDRTLVPNDDAKIVQMMFDWYAKEKVTFCHIAQRLTNMGISSPGGLNYWNVGTVSKLIKNDVYIGKVHHGRFKDVKEYDAETNSLKKIQKKSKPDEIVTADGKHPAIIDMDTWNAACARHSKNVRLPVSRELSNPLAGLLRCPTCGQVVPYKVENRSKKTYCWFRHRSDRPNGCVSYSSRYEEVMDELIYALNGYIADFSAKIDNADGEEARKHEAMISEMEKNLAALKAKRKKVFQFYEDDIYTEEEFMERRSEINDEITMLTARIEEAQATTPVEIDYRDKYMKFTEAVNALQNPKSTAKDKNDLLKEIVCRIDYTKTAPDAPMKLDITLV